ncbi:hypothetical protein L1987_37290 [Smallanthus sonchifolius]|uniref:Uncharacterized protein n=1 Tax=Smallanthus sonchifolius TaxID=185202 RepID=A0ACB9HGD7_9ASTR|nr:hypothetical protein L1987_37290 [Smallanthus sonchifolius]
MRVLQWIHGNAMDVRQKEALIWKMDVITMKRLRKSVGVAWIEESGLTNQSKGRKGGSDSQLVAIRRLEAKSERLNSQEESVMPVYHQSKPSIRILNPS